MMLAQVKGWDMVNEYRRNANKARAKIVVLGVLDTLLNTIINNSLHDEFEQQEQARVIALAEYRRKAKPVSRRTYYAIPKTIVDGKLLFTISCKKPAHDNYSKVRGAKRSEVRAICNELWNKEAA